MSAKDYVLVILDWLYEHETGIVVAWILSKGWVKPLPEAQRRDE